MFLGYYDPDKTRPATSKLANAVLRYIQKFDAEPDTCLMSPEDATFVLADPRGPKNLTVKGVDYVPRHTFYVGVEDQP